MDMTEIVLTGMEELDCPRALTVAILWRYEQWKELVSLKTLPKHYANHLAYFSAAQATDFLRKSPDIPTGIDRRANALQKWREAELENTKTNARFANYLSGFYPNCDPRLVTFCDRVKKQVAYLLGKFPARIEPRFGPGATVSDTSRWATVPDKISSKPTFTSSASFLLPLWRETAWGRSLHETPNYNPQQVRGNIFFTVPKDGETDRACAKGPSLNVAYQLGAARVIRQNLRRVGIDLDNAQDLHRRVACMASLTGRSCTIDLTSASDMVAKNLVKFLLPELWFDLLDSLREKFTRIDGKDYYLEKFSAMGNGFTFELETVIFAGITRACCPGSEDSVLVYGDDIICPTEFAQDVLAALRWFGFKPNPNKTFVDGPFRESCGGDFWLGRAVRPFQIDSFPCEPHEWIALANGWNRVAPDLKRTWFRILDRIPVQIRGVRGPQALGDIVIHDEQPRWQTRTKHSIRYVKTYAPLSHKRVWLWGYSYSVQLATALYGTMLFPLPRIGDFTDVDRRYLIPREGVTGYGFRWVPFS
jgi:hypothetical protein